MIFRTPNNFKKGAYVLRKYRVKDIIFMVVSIFASLISMLVYMSYFKTINIFVLLLLLLPGAISFLFCTPLPIYFNLWERIKFEYRYYRSTKKYYWAGIYQFDEAELHGHDVHVEREEEEKSEE
ncbi:MAG: hypothetical protein RR598_11710 [Anaerorhabdus sp.]